MLREPSTQMRGSEEPEAMLDKTRSLHGRPSKTCVPSYLGVEYPVLEADCAPASSGRCCMG